MYIPFSYNNNFCSLLNQLHKIADMFPSKHGIWWHVDPRSLFCLLGMAIRIAQRIGLHRDGAQFGLSPFEVEMRRRLWWQLAAFDKRLGEISGSSSTALTMGADTKLPLNINDADLHVDAKEPPAPHTGPTEMLFALTRAELTKAIQRSPWFLMANWNTENSEVCLDRPKAGAPGFTSGLQNQRPIMELDDLCKHMEETYLQQCDTKIPFHLFTVLMTWQALCKMKVIQFLCIETEQKRPSEQAPPATQCRITGTPQKTMLGSNSQHSFPETTSWSTPDNIDKDIQLQIAIRTIETDNRLYDTASLRGWHWMVQMYLPFPSYMFLIHELRRVTTGELCAQAWTAITENHEKRKSIMTLKNPMHIVMGHHFVKAWDARVAAEREIRGDASAEELKCPAFIQRLKDHLKKFGRKGSQFNGPTPRNDFPGGYRDGNERLKILSRSSTGPNTSPNLGAGFTPRPPPPRQQQQQLSTRQSEFTSLNDTSVRSTPPYSQPSSQKLAVSPADDSRYSVNFAGSTNTAPSTQSNISDGNMESPPPGLIEGLDIFAGPGMGQFFGTVGDFAGMTEAAAAFGVDMMDWSFLLPEYSGNGGSVSVGPGGAYLNQGWSNES